MRKIKYPEKSKLREFQQEYVNGILCSKYFDKNEAENILKKAGISCPVDEFLVLPLDELILLPEIDYSGLGKVDKEKKRNEYKNPFNYSKLRGNVLSPFFMKHADTLNLKTCFYCNLDFINAYVPFSRGYMDFFHFMDTCEIEDLIRIRGVREKIAKKIIGYRGWIKRHEDIERYVKDKRIRNILLLLAHPTGKLCYENGNFKSSNHYTLDHFLPQATYPHFSLCLFNLVPCCATCNSKLKGSRPLYGDSSEITNVSPTGQGILDLKFRILFRNGFDEKNLPENGMNYVVNIDSPYREYVRILNLQGRYDFHKGTAMELIEKRRKYPDSKIREISKLCMDSQISLSETELKKQIFGRTIFEEEETNRPLEKYSKDIATQLGLISYL